uniref:Uncharacterized protein n=1 Tax=Nelumbo nucifera TaxID=4432 RepID=A0A822XNT2_NELNU|nr:TPA_asm: hypothetical protein HUJ06_023165 [Nelumbo nucifera]
MTSRRNLGRIGGLPIGGTNILADFQILQVLLVEVGLCGVYIIPLIWFQD